MATRKTTSRNKNRENVVVLLHREYNPKSGKYTPEVRSISTMEHWEKDYFKNANTTPRDLINKERDKMVGFPSQDIIKASYVKPYQVKNAIKKGKIEFLRIKKWMDEDPSIRYDIPYLYQKPARVESEVLANYALRNISRDNRGKHPLLRRGLTYRTPSRSKRR